MYFKYIKKAWRNLVMELHWTKPIHQNEFRAPNSIVPSEYYGQDNSDRVSNYYKGKLAEFYNQLREIFTGIIFFLALTCLAFVGTSALGIYFLWTAKSILACIAAGLIFLCGVPLGLSVYKWYSVAGEFALYLELIFEGRDTFDEPTKSKAQTESLVETAETEQAPLKFDILKYIGYISSIANPAIQSCGNRVLEVAKNFMTPNLDKQKRSVISSFMAKYEPLFIKQLDDYRCLTEQPIMTQNIKLALQSIANSLEELASAFETQFDRLFEGQTIDSDTDLQLIKTLKKNDSITQGSDFRNTFADESNVQIKEETEC